MLIDGYNVLGALGPWSRLTSPSGEAVREEFISKLVAYARQRGCTLTVVFDAWRQTGHLQKIEHRAGVTVMYSGTSEKADQVIQELVRSGGKDVAVVSSDHEVVATAKASGAFTMRAEEFADRLNQVRRASRSLPSSRVKRMRPTLKPECPKRKRETHGNYPRKSGSETGS